MAVGSIVGGGEGMVGMVGGAYAHEVPKDGGVLEVSRVLLNHALDLVHGLQHNTNKI